MSVQVISLKLGEIAAPLSDPTVMRAQQGDAEAFRSLYQQYRAMVARLAYQITGSSQDIEDIIQDVFLQVHRSIRSFQGDSKFSTWLYRLAVNVTMQQLRQRAKRPGPHCSIDAISPLPDTGRSPEEAALEGEKRRILNAALDKVSEKKRVVFVLHELMSIDAKEIAGLLGIPTLTVRTRLFYARKAVYRMLMSEAANEKARNEE